MLHGRLLAITADPFELLDERILMTMGIGFATSGIHGIALSRQHGTFDQGLVAAGPERAHDSAGLRDARGERVETLVEKDEPVLLAPTHVDRLMHGRLGSTEPAVRQGRGSRCSVNSVRTLMAGAGQPRQVASSADGRPVRGSHGAPRTSGGVCRRVELPVRFQVKR